MSLLTAAADDEDGDTINALRAAVQQACDWISEEPGRRPISAGRLLDILTNALAAAPQPPIPSNPRQQQPQGEQEPVAWISPSALEWSTRESEKVVKLTRKAQPEYDFTEPLYTHPQPAQKPLTDEEILKAVRHLYHSDLPVGMGFSDDLDVARAIERAHGIGGEA